MISVVFEKKNIPPHLVEYNEMVSIKTM